MRARFHVSSYPLRGRYRPAGDEQAAIERWWADLARVFPHDVPPGDTGVTRPPRPHEREERDKA
jgi:hypothetical protein